MSFIGKNYHHKAPLTPRDALFLNVLCFLPVGTLLQMEKAVIRHSLAKARLISRWLEGILELTTKLDEKGE